MGRPQSGSPETIVKPDISAELYRRGEAAKNVAIPLMTTGLGALAIANFMPAAKRWLRLTALTTFIAGGVIDHYADTLIDGAIENHKQANDLQSKLMLVKDNDQALGS